MKQVPCEVFCRIVGYYRPLSNWNAGKLEEFYDRATFSIAPSEAKCEELVEIKAVV
jgi:hypothetical protein